jgi:hypothetical protein
MQKTARNSIINHIVSLSFMILCGVTIQWLLIPEFLQIKSLSEYIAMTTFGIIVGSLLIKWDSLPKRKTANGYTQLYYRILPYADFGNTFLAIFIGLNTLQGIIVIVGATEKQLSLVDSVVAVIPNILNILTSLLIWPIMKIAFRLNLDPQIMLPQYIVKLLFIEKHPYSEEKRLLYSDLEKLKSIAEIEQSSIDWRANTVTIGLISGISLIIGVFQFFSPWDGSLKEAFPLANAHINSMHPDWGQYQWLLWLLGGIPIIVSFFWLLYQLIRALAKFVDFISSETPNRIIILACQEAMYILEYFNSDKCEQLSYTKRKQIAEHLGYKIVDRNTISAAERRISFWIQEDESNGFYLSPIVGPPKWRQIVDWVFTTMKTSVDKLIAHINRTMKRNKQARCRK